MTETLKNAPTVAASASEPQADQIQYLTPTPPGFAPEYDYFAVVQSLIDTAGIRKSDPPYQSPFQPLDVLLKNRNDTSSDAVLMRSAWSGELLPLRPYSPGIRVKEMYEEILRIRQLLTHGGKSILVVDNISPTALQILGAAIDLDPTFLWRHYNEALDRPGSGSESNTLRKRFFSLVAAAKKRRAERDTFRMSSTDEDFSLHLRYCVYKMSLDMGYGSVYDILSHISCYFITANSCEYPFLLRLIIS